MKKLTEQETRIVRAMGDCFYKIVPLELRTYCAVTALVSKTVLRHFGIETGLLPCQVWCATPARNFVVGFLGKAHPGRWDGHVVCSGNGFILDTALHHFFVDFGVTVPSVVAAPKFMVPTQVISRFDLDQENRLWWFAPPNSPEIDLHIPHEPPEVIEKYSAQLINQLTALGLSAAETGTLHRAQAAQHFPSQNA